MAKPDAPWLGLSAETTRHGLVPACSWPRVGSSSASQTSPREGSGIVGSSRVSRRGALRIEIVASRDLPQPPLLELFLPRLGIVLKGGISCVGRIEETLPTIVFDRLLQNGLH